MTVIRPVQTSLIEGMERPVGPILPSVFTGTNADLMRAVAPLYLTGSVLDTTYGDGKWWERFRPDGLICHDKFKVDGVDFCALPENDASIDTVCFDPPYVISGSPSKDRLCGEFQDRFGIGTHNLGEARNTDAGNRTFHDLIRTGLGECARVSRKWILVKCMEFAQGSHAKTDFHDIPYLVTKWALEFGCVKHDQIVHYTGAGPGGHNIFNVKRARRVHSYLLVFAPPRTSPPRAFTPAADDILDLTDAEFHTKYGVTPDSHLDGDIDDLLPPSRPTVDVACPILDGPEAA